MKTIFLNLKKEESGKFFFSFQFMQDQQWIKPSFFFHLGIEFLKAEAIWLSNQNINLSDNAEGTTIYVFQLDEENLKDVCSQCISLMEKEAMNLIHDYVYESISEDQKETYEYNVRVLESIGLTLNSECLDYLLEGAQLNGTIEIVSQPTGKKQETAIPNDFFSEVYVDQSSNGEDSFWGFIYGKFSEDQWLKIGFIC